MVVVTGANGDIGRNLTRALLDDGYRVTGLDVKTDAVAALHDDPPDHVLVLETDVTDADAVHDAIDHILDEWGHIDVLANNAAVGAFEPFQDKHSEALHREFDVNLFGALHTTRAVLAHMLDRDHGIIHFLGSGTAVGGHPGLTGYAATKAALDAFVRSLRMELTDTNVTCTLMQPPMTDTSLSRGLGWPDFMLNDPETVGRTLADKIESRGPITYADIQTKIGLTLIDWFPGVWRWAVNRYVELPSGGDD